MGWHSQYHVLLATSSDVWCMCAALSALGEPKHLLLSVREPALIKLNLASLLDVRLLFLTALHTCNACLQASSTSIPAAASRQASTTSFKAPIAAGPRAVQAVAKPPSLVAQVRLMMVGAGAPDLHPQQDCFDTSHACGWGSAIKKRLHVCTAKIPSRMSQ